MPSADINVDHPQSLALAFLAGASDSDFTVSRSHPILLLFAYYFKYNLCETRESVVML